MINTDLLQYLCCLKCKSDLIEQDNFLVCKKCGEKYEIDEGIVRIIPNLTVDTELSINKWDGIYKRKLQNKNYYNDYKEYIKNYYQDTYSQLNNEKEINTEVIYLEIGCGPLFLGQLLASKVKLVIGIDFCPSALKIAKKMFEDKGIKNYLLIQGDILNMPVKSNAIDLIYGGGVIEHFKDTQKCVNELYRILKKNGVSFNTVPYLNIGSLTYRQFWGNIPNFPILKQMAEFIHIKLLKEKHMKFGYELSFLSSTLRDIHKKAGFKKVYIDRFKVKLVFNFIPTKFLKKICIKIANSNRLFWPMIKVIAQK